MCCSGPSSPAGASLECEIWKTQVHLGDRHGTRKELLTLEVGSEGNGRNPGVDIP